MARHARLFVVGMPVLVEHRAKNGAFLAREADELSALLGAVRARAAAGDVAVLAYGIDSRRLRLVVESVDAAALARAIQAIARAHARLLRDRYGHAQRAIWDGRYRSAVLEPGTMVLKGMVHAERIGTTGLGADPPPGLSSSDHHSGRARQSFLVDPLDYWALGNTPYDRQEAWRQRLAAPADPVETRRIEHALRGGWYLGDAPSDQVRANRAPRARPRGRPKTSPLK